MELLTVMNWGRKGGKQEYAREKLLVFCFLQNSTWVAIQSTPRQEGNETFQGLLTTPPEIPEDHCHVSVDIYLIPVHKGKFNMLNGPHTLTLACKSVV